MTAAEVEQPVPRGSVLRRNAVASALRAGSTSLTTILLPIVLVVVLPTDAYAVWALMFSIAAFTLYFDLGAQAAVMALVGRADAAGDHAAALAAGRAGLRVASAVGAAAVVVGAILAGFIGGLFPSIPPGQRAAAGVTLVLLFAGQALSLIGTALAAYFGGRQRTATATAVLVPVRFASLVATCIAAALGADLVVLGVVFVVPLAVGAALLLARLIGEQRALVGRDRRSHLSAAHLLRFSGTLILWNVCMLVVSGLDLTVVGRVDFAHVAVYSIASTFAVGVAGLDNAIIAPLLPELSGRIGRGDAPSAAMLLGRASRMNAILLGGVLVSIAAVAPVLAAVLLGSTDPTLAVAVIVILAAANCLRLAVAPLSLGFVAGGTHTKLILQPLAETITNLIASIALGVMFGAVGVALGTLVGAIVGVVTAMTWSLHVAGRELSTFRALLRQVVRAPLLAWAPAVALCVAVWLSGLRTSPLGVVIGVAGVVASIPTALLMLGPDGRAPLRRLVPARVR